MTYKNASDLQDYQKRVGSHATKPSRTGRINDLPAWAKEPEEYYRSIRDQVQSLIDQLTPLQKEADALAFRLRSSLPFEEYDRLKYRHDIVGQKMQIIQNALHEKRPLARAAARHAWGTVYYLVAQELLDRDKRIQIDNEVQEILSRPIQEIAKSSGEKYENNPEAKHRNNKLGKMKKKRHRLENTRKTQDNLVVRWELIDGQYRRVVIKHGVRTVDDGNRQNMLDRS